MSLARFQFLCRHLYPLQALQRNQLLRLLEYRRVLLVDVHRPFLLGSHQEPQRDRRLKLPVDYQHANQRGFQQHFQAANLPRSLPVIRHRFHLLYHRRSQPVNPQEAQLHNQVNNPRRQLLLHPVCRVVFPQVFHQLCRAAVRLPTLRIVLPVSLQLFRAQDLVYVRPVLQRQNHLRGRALHRHCVRLGYHLLFLVRIRPRRLLGVHLCVQRGHRPVFPRVLHQERLLVFLLVSQQCHPVVNRLAIRVETRRPFQQAILP